MFSDTVMPKVLQLGSESRSLASEAHLFSKKPGCSNCVKPCLDIYVHFRVFFGQISLFIEMNILMHKLLSSELMICLEETTVSELAVTEYCLRSHQPGY